MFFCEICKIFKKSYFEERLRLFSVGIEWKHLSQFIVMYAQIMIPHDIPLKVNLITSVRFVPNLLINQITSLLLCLCSSILKQTVFSFGFCMWLLDPTLHIEVNLNY